ncbi:vWA domain-containing protein [Tropicibacter alexandrii]|uniref:vWA domain-containing protein n=1 Tax=Tropicibacter alexandrii TaxID=2267683 RepID=UPI000EF55725|nr:vWA domain-containing protein [Tropicibacter alexandrii]
MNILKFFFRQVLVTATALVAVFAGLQARAQVGLPPGQLSLNDTTQCAALGEALNGNESGGQWLIGSDVTFYGQSNARQPIDTRDGLFEPVGCYSEVDLGSTRRIFVANGDRSLCGWVDASQLLDPHALSDRKSAVCETPRAMKLEDFCSPENARFSENLIDCNGVPRGLRAKGVLMGSTLETETGPYPFMTAPVGGRQLDSRLFFSVLEIHDLAMGDRNAPMALVGDGEGDMFGWINLRAIQLWPTRIGLYYDQAGEGRMFQDQKSMIQHMRDGGQTRPTIEPDLSPSELSSFLHGNLPPLSYPLVRISSPDLVGSHPDDLPAYHEVIFLGKSGEGSATQLMSEAQLAREVDKINQLNVMLVIDTTESMRPYLSAVQSGIGEFVRSYRSRSLNASNRLPDLRVGVYAYSDFQSNGATAMLDPIVAQEIMPPSRIETGFDIDARLARVAEHTGLNDAAGGFPEAALEAVVQLSAGFEQNRAWFADGPRIVIHMADHGSRPALNLNDVIARLNARNVYYLPVAISTDDEGNPRRTTAREDFVKQALTVFAPNVEGSNASDFMPVIDFRDDGALTANTVQAQLDLAMDTVLDATNQLRARVTGRSPKDEVQDAVASRIRIDDQILEDRGLNPDDIVIFAEASTGFAPRELYHNGLFKTINWTYSVALEPKQASDLKDQFSAMCRAVGAPDQEEQFRRLVVRLAESFSGDQVVSNDDVLAILSDLAEIPGANRSLLAQSPQTLISRAKSIDPVVVDKLRQDVCWVSYHLGNMSAGLYARPEQLAWNGSEFAPKVGEQPSGRTYTYKPIVGAETVYLPNFFFYLSDYAERTSEEPSGPCIFDCN